MAFPPNWPFLFLTSSNTEPQVLTGYSGSLTHTIGIFINVSFCSSLDKDWNKVNVFDWILSELDLLLWNQTTHVLSFFLLCICLSSSLAEEKAREAESKARALELKIGDDLSKEARVRRHNHSNTHTHTHTHTHTSDPELNNLSQRLFCETSKWLQECPMNKDWLRSSNCFPKA